MTVEEQEIMPVEQGTVALRLSGIHKAYPGVVALNNVSIVVRAGEVHAIVGENGAGKSTLIGVAAGSVTADAGTVEIGDRVLVDNDPRAAQAAGLAVVYQHPALLPDLTVGENMALAMPRDRRPLLARVNSWAAEVLRTHGVELDPSRRAEDLTVAERHLVEIAKALHLEPTVLILDEPTEPLDAGEIDALFVRLNAVAARGTAVVYISHRLPEVRRLADRLTVLRDGTSRGTFEASEVSEQDLIKLIVGRDLEAPFLTRSSEVSGKTVMTVEGLSMGDAFEDVGFEMSFGEVVGLGGIAGNGQVELLRALAGQVRARGTVTLGGSRLRLGSIGAASRAGIVYLSGDRQSEGIFHGLGVRENMTVGALNRFSTAGVMHGRAERSAVQARIDEFTVRTPSAETPADSLSGGNQQKVLLARAMLREPKVLLVEEPTAGVDVGARQEIYRVLREAADRGVAVVVYSSDVKELEGLCDKVLVMSRGKLANQLVGDEVNEEAITSAALTSTHLRTRSEATAAGRIRRFLNRDSTPSIVLAILIVGLAIYTNNVNARFLSDFNINGVLFSVSTVVFLALAQQLVMITGGIDLSLGPMVGFLVILASFRLPEGASTTDLILTVIYMMVAGLALGAANGCLVRFLKMTPLVATLVTYTILLGAALLLRPTPDGQIDIGIVDQISTVLGGMIPVMFVVAVALAVLLEVMLRWTTFGLALRAVGSEESVAGKLGVKTQSIRFAAFAGAGALTAVGAVVLMAQIGVGDASVGTPFTLSSITAVVLGGASIYGARGSFIGALLGALLLQEFIKATVFLNAGPAWQYWLVGLLALTAAGLYSRLRASLSR